MTNKEITEQNKLLRAQIKGLEEEIKAIQDSPGDSYELLRQQVVDLEEENKKLLAIDAPAAKEERDGILSILEASLPTGKALNLDESKYVVRITPVMKQIRDRGQ